MKNKILVLSILALSSGFVFAEDKDRIDTFLSVSRNMQKSISENAQILQDLHLDVERLEILMPDEQFKQICDAITARYANEPDPQKNKCYKLHDAELIFGKENASAILPVVGNPKEIEAIRLKFRDAYEVFAGYHTTQESAASVVDWGWGDSDGLTVNPNIGTLGYGMDIGYEFSRFFKVRAHIGSGDLKQEMNLSDTRGNFSWENKRHFGLFFDWHPRGSQFHITAGLLYMDPRVRVEARYHGTTQAYNNTGTALARYDVFSDYIMDGKWNNAVQPYIGIGWASDGSKKCTPYFSFDFGFAYLGEGSYAESGEARFFRNGRRVEHSDPEWKANSDALATLQQFDRNVRDAVGKVAHFLNHLYVYPVLQFGVGFRF